MKKIISLFQRNYDTDRLVRDEVVPGAEWVLAGEGVATRKFDGTCAMIRDGHWYKRHELKKGRMAPSGFEPAQDPDSITGDIPGWVPIAPDGRADAPYREAAAVGFDAQGYAFAFGTYELCGPKVNGNPEQYSTHVLIRHGHVPTTEDPRTFQTIKTYLDTAGIEGIVWHHPDGRMVKIKRRDFFKKETL